MTTVQPSDPLVPCAYDPAFLEQQRRPRMIASLLSSSALVVWAFFLAGSVARLLPRPQAVEIVLPIAEHQVERRRISSPPDATPVPPRVRIRPAPPASDVVPHPTADRLIDPSTDPRITGEADESRPNADVRLGRVRSEPAAEPDDRPINVLGQPPLVDQLPVPIHVVKPVYDDLPLHAGVEGLVLVDLLVGRDGLVRDVRLDPERHVPMLDAAALAAARQWRFEPALSGGHPVAVWVSVPFRFSLTVRP